MRKILWRMIPMAVLVAGMGCMQPGDGVGLNQYGQTLVGKDYFTNNVLPIFSVCTGCHNPYGGSGWAATGLDLSPDTAYALLVNVPAAEPLAQNLPPMLRINPGHPDSSYLYLKVTEAKPPYGAQMPAGGAPLTSDQIEILRAWIQAGAPR